MDPVAIKTQMPVWAHTWFLHYEVMIQWTRSHPIELSVDVRTEPPNRHESISPQQSGTNMEKNLAQLARTTRLTTNWWIPVWLSDGDFIDMTRSNTEGACFGACSWWTLEILYSRPKERCNREERVDHSTYHGVNLLRREVCFVSHARLMMAI